MKSFQELNKDEIALMQLVDSIQLFNHERYISAITLGGAAEELLGALLKQFGNENNINIPTKAELDNSLFELTTEIHGIKNYISYRNNTRNEIKHHGDERNKDIVKGNFKQQALNYISGAIINYKLKHNQLPTDVIISGFCLRYGIN